MTVKRIYGLLVIVTVAWLLILGESYFFIVIVRPLGPPLHLADLPSTVLKVLITAGLGILWVGVMFAMVSLHTKFTRTPTSAS